MPCPEADDTLALSSIAVPLGNKALPTILALAAVFTLLGVSNGVGWFSKNSQAGAAYIAKWEALDVGAGFTVSLLLVLVYTRLRKRLSGVWLVLAASALCYAGGALWLLLAQVGLWQCGLNSGLSVSASSLLVRGGLMDGTTLGLISFLYFSIEHWRQAAEQRELAQQARLQMLRYQLNPHFLFNALNSIRGMIVEDPERSRQLVTELADFLRYSLDDRRPQGVINDEILAINSYLAIQRIRFDSQLDATVRVDDAALEVAVPCFLIHPLVENAVKYGMTTSPMPLRLRIDVSREGDQVGIRVSNTGRLLAQSETGPANGLPESTGIGLRNIADRLKLAFPGHHSFHISEAGGWVHAEIRLRIPA